MTIDQIRQQIREDTNTTTNDYSDASLIRDLNSEVIAVHTHILAMRGPMEFDDPNQAGYSTESLTITAGTDTYDVQQDDDSQNIYTIHKVVFNGKDVSRLAFEGDYQEYHLNTSDEAATPSGFFDLGKAIRFTEKPSISGTATIYYDRQHHYIETGDTSLELGLPRAYHQLVGKRVARNYAGQKSLPNVNWLTNQVAEMEDRLEWYEENRRGDELVRLTVDTPKGI